MTELLSIRAETSPLLPPDPLRFTTSYETSEGTEQKKDWADSSLAQFISKLTDMIILTGTQQPPKRQQMEWTERSTEPDEEANANILDKEAKSLSVTSLQDAALKYGVDVGVAQAALPTARLAALPTPVEMPKRAVSIDETAQRVMRIHFAKQILRELQWLEQKGGDPIAAMYVDSLFSKMRTMRDLSPTDPFVEVLMALYDAMAANNNWLNLKAHHFREAASILKKLLRRRKITEDAVEQAILSLEEIGFDTTPFGGEIGEEE